MKIKKKMKIIKIFSRSKIVKAKKKKISKFRKNGLMNLIKIKIKKKIKMQLIKKKKKKKKKKKLLINFQDKTRVINGRERVKRQMIF